jgi:small conductance mechanosensitive channel
MTDKNLLQLSPTHMDLAVQAILPLLVDNALHVLGAIAILIIGIWLSGQAAKFSTRLFTRAPHFDAMLRSFFSSIARYFVLTLTVLAILSQFGVQTASLVTVIGAASLAIGLALQGTLSNLAAGVMLLIFRPFKIGQHVIISGNDGTVKELTLFWTEIVTADAVQVIIPNGSVWGSAIKNLSTYTPPVAAIELRIPAPPPAQLNAALAAIQTILTTDQDIAKDPAPSVLLDRSPTDNTLQIIANFTPAATANAAQLRSFIIKQIHDQVEVSE